MNSSKSVDTDNSGSTQWVRKTKKDMAVGKGLVEWDCRVIR